MENDLTVDRTKLRYVLYARKSSEDDSKQLRTVDDQIKECVALAERNGVKIVRPYLREARSAKTPDNRPIFTQMLKDVRSGKYDGIMAWHPDRLARNMREGGEIIDMLDEGSLKDLYFVTHYFTNNASGKMLLGMAFVLSKHYSDDLSQKVTKSMRGNLEDAISSGTPKHGYIRMPDGKYEPDSNNFVLLRKGWEMRMQGNSFSRIATELNSQGYGRMTKDKLVKGGKIIKGHAIKLGVDILRNIFDDPFYYGVLIQTEKPVDLRLAYNFQPMVTEEEYNQVQTLNKSKSKKVALSKAAKAYLPLRGLVTCVYCSRSMTPGASANRKGVKYLYYRCTTKDCVRVKKAIRAKVVFEYIYEVLKDGLQLTEVEYKQYAEQFGTLTEEKLIDARTAIENKRGRMRHISREKSALSQGMAKLAARTEEDYGDVLQQNASQLRELKEEEQTLAADIAKLEADISDPDTLKLSYEEVLNISKNAASKVMAGNEVQKDVICQLIFLNIAVDEEKVANYRLQEPFATLLSAHNAYTGRGDWI